jgi:hypothetical protein
VKRESLLFLIQSIIKQLSLLFFLIFIKAQA